MATIIIEDVPDKVVESYWTKISYNNIKTSFLPKKKINVQKKDYTVELNKLVIDPENVSYWPFNDMTEALKFLNRDLW